MEDLALQPKWEVDWAASEPPWVAELRQEVAELRTEVARIGESFGGGDIKGPVAVRDPRLSPRRSCPN